MNLGYLLGNPIMLQLGSFQFGLSTAAYQELTRSSEYRWPSQDRYGALPALQSTGPGAESVTLTGVVFPEWRGGAGQCEAMRALAETQKPQLLVSVEGDILGRWVIERIEEKQSIFAAGGAARKQEFTLQLKRFD